MKSAFLILVFILATFACSTLTIRAQDVRCSTEQVNHVDCTFTLDRRYPVTFPTLQMAHGMKVKVIVNNPLPFETLTLDETGATLLPGTDQGAALVPLAIPQLAGFTWSNATIPSGISPGAAPGTAPPTDPIIDERLAALDKILADTVTKTIQLHLDDLRYQVTTIYAQLSQVLSPLPRPLSPAPTPAATVPAPTPAAVLAPAPAVADCRVAHPNVPLPPLVSTDTPNPWECYPDWRRWLKCEIAGICMSEKPQPQPIPMPTFQNALGTVNTIQSQLPSGSTPPANPLFDQKSFDALVQSTQALIGVRPDPAERQHYTIELQKRQNAENDIVTWMAVLSNALSGVQKDFMTYYENIELATGALLASAPPAVPPATPIPLPAVPNPMVLGWIFDPRAASGTATPYPKFLGRQVVFSVNAVNLIATGRASVTTSTAKTSLATVTVIYADPIFEGSAGVIFSFVHNRTFSNETVGTPLPANSPYTQGDVIIQETKPEPEIVPFVAGNWRLGPDFTWLNHRRGAVYATVYLGLNPYTKLPEYGLGPTASWRSLMLSAFYERVHDTRLITGQTVGAVVCAPAAGSSPPACASTPTAPVANPFATNAFGIALSVRVPTTFTAGTGGVSH
jgi:hypothetical protein